MAEDDFSHLAGLYELGDDPVPQVVLDLAAGVDVEFVWRNELGGLTFRLGDRYVKWNPRRTGIDLEREIERLAWISSRHPAPAVIDSGADDEAQWLLTAALRGEPAVGDTWRAPPHRSHHRHRHRASRHPRHRDRRLPDRVDRTGLGWTPTGVARASAATRRPGGGAWRRLRSEHLDRICWSVDGQRRPRRPCRR